MWRKLHPELSTEEDKEESVAVNKTRNSLSSLRQSTPYRMVSQGMQEAHNNNSNPTNRRQSAPTCSNMPQVNTPSRQRRANPVVDQSTRSEPDPLIMFRSSTGAHSRRRASAHVDQSTRSAPDAISFASSSTTPATKKPQPLSPPAFSRLFGRSPAPPTGATKKPQPPASSRQTPRPVCRTYSGDHTVKQSNRHSVCDKEPCVPGAAFVV
jgi:hypothetical protein